MTKQRLYAVGLALLSCGCAAITYRSGYPIMTYIWLGIAASYVLAAACAGLSPDLPTTGYPIGDWLEAVDAYGVNSYQANEVYAANCRDPTFLSLVAQAERLRQQGMEVHWGGEMRLPLPVRAQGEDAPC